MPTLDTLMTKRRVRMMVLGYPGAGKTGSLACLANAGYRLRILDFDGNPESLFDTVRPDCHANVEIVTLEDRLRAGEKVIEASGAPKAFATALALLNSWKYATPGGEVDLGGVRTWGDRDVLVIDSLTGLGDAIMRRILFLNNRNPLTRRIQDWGAVMADEDALMQMVTASDIPCHVVVTSHLKLIGPKTIQDTEPEPNKAIKTEIAELVPTRLYPSAIGQGLPPLIAQHFPTVVLIEGKAINGKVKPTIFTQPRPELDLKVPAQVPAELPLADGMLTLFRALTGATPEAAPKAA